MNRNRYLVLVKTREKDKPQTLMSYLCSMKAESTDKNILTNLGIGVLNEMQVAARNTILKEQHIMLLSPTGTGKTLAFLLPIVQLLDDNTPKVQCLIVVPSRELALQIEQVWKKMGTRF